MSAKDVEASAEKHSYDGSPRTKVSPVATDVLAGDVFEGHTQSTQRVSLFPACSKCPC